MPASTTSFPFKLHKVSPTETLWCCGMEGCGKVIDASKKSGISYHKNTHNPKYKCADCDAVFAQKAQLTQHTRAAHTGEKPYQCACCERAFPQLANLQDHVRKNHAGMPIPKTAVATAATAYSATALLPGKEVNGAPSSGLREHPGTQGSGVSPSKLGYVSTDKAWVDLMEEMDVLLGGNVGRCQLDHGARAGGAEALSTCN